jgi:hypothetical protein
MRMKMWTMDEVIGRDRDEFKNERVREDGWRRVGLHTTFDNLSFERLYIVVSSYAIQLPTERRESCSCDRTQGGEIASESFIRSSGPCGQRGWCCILGG